MPITFDDLPNEAKPAISFEDLPNETPNPSLGQQVYSLSDMPAKAAGGMLGGLVGSAAGPLGAVAGGTLGTMGASEARRLIGTALGYEKPRTPEEMAKEQLRNAEIGALGEAGGQVAGNLLSRATTSVTNSIRSLFGSPTQQAIADTATTGIPLSVPEASGSRFGQATERFLLGAPGSRDIYSKLQETQLNRSMDALDNVVNRLGQPGIDKGTLGGSIERAYNDAVNTAVRARTTQGAADYAFLDTSMGNTAYLPVPGFIKALDEQASKLDYIGASRIEQLKAAQLRSIASDISSAGGRITGRAANAMLSRYSSAMHGNDSLFESLSKDASDRLLAGDAFRALDNDLANVAMNTKAQVPQAIADGIAVARNNWKLNSDALRELQDTVIGRTLNLGKATPEAIYAKVTTLPVTELRQTTRVLDAIDPTIMQDVRAMHLQDLITKSSTAKPVVGTDMPERVLDYNTFTKNILKQQDTFQIMFPDASVRNQIGAIANQFQRIDASGKPMQFNYGLMSTTMPGVIALYPLVTGNPGVAVGLAVSSGAIAITTNQLAKMLTEPAGRRAWGVLTNQTASRTAGQNALAYVSNFVAQNVISE